MVPKADNVYIQCIYGNLGFLDVFLALLRSFPGILRANGLFLEALFTHFAAFCWPPHLSPGLAAAAEEIAAKMYMYIYRNLGFLDAFLALLRAFPGILRANVLFLRPFPGIPREYTYGNWQFCHGKRAAVCFGTFPAK